MDETEQLVAITVVCAGDGLKRPDAVFEASTMVADELVALGAARRSDPDEAAGDEPSSLSGRAA